MNVTVKLFAQYRENRFKVEQRVYKKGIHASEIIEELGVAKALPIGVLMVNSRHESESYILQEGDIIALFPKVGGG
ncbi:MAG: MoaD/ThiS family protein [Campylobacteraceae bacterium]|nr:MoaD/ThiS family protein [Campylobacteraceae bacterium]